MVREGPGKTLVMCGVTIPPWEVRFAGGRRGAELFDELSFVDRRNGTPGGVAKSVGELVRERLGVEGVETGTDLMEWTDRLMVDLRRDFLQGRLEVVGAQELPEILRSQVFLAVVQIAAWGEIRLQA